MSSIKAIAGELKLLLVEKKNLSVRAKQLNKRIHELEKVMTEFLSNQHLEKAKYMDIIFEVKQQKFRPTKNKDERAEDIKMILRNNGVDDVDSIYNDILNAQRGEEEDKAKLIIKKIRR